MDDSRHPLTMPASPNPFDPESPIIMPDGSIRVGHYQPEETLMSYDPEHDLTDADSLPDVAGVWLTAARRRAIYTMAVAVGVLLVAYGVVTDSQWQPILGVVEQGLVLLTVVMPHTDEASTRSAA